MPAESRLVGAIRAQAAARPRFMPRAGRPGLPRAGEIRLLRAMRGGVQRLAAVLSVHREPDFLEICLLSNELDMMSAYDVVLTHSETGLPFKVIAQLDLVAPVYPDQATSCFGRIASEAMVQQLLAASAGDVAGLSPALRGLPMRGPSDPRWVFKEAELATLHELSRDCLFALVEGP